MYIVRSIISTKEILDKITDFIGEKNFGYFPSPEDCQLIHLGFNHINKIDRLSKDIIGVQGFVDFRIYLLEYMIECSKIAPVAYLERVFEQNRLSESIIVLSNGRNVLEISNAKNAITSLFNSGLIHISQELKEYIGYSPSTPEKILNFRAYTKKHRNRTLTTCEDLFDMGWYLYVYNEDGSSSHDYLQDSFQACKELAEDLFDVPQTDWVKLER